MRIIESTAGWLGSMLDGLTEMELYELFDEIAEQLASDIASTNPMVEDSVTFEIARRGNNNLQRGWA